MKTQPELDVIRTDCIDLERRRALGRLGLGLPAAYVVPVLLTLSTPATADGRPSGGSSSGDASGPASGQ